MASTPSAWPSLRIDSDSIPPSSTSLIAAVRTWAFVSGTLRPASIRGLLPQRLTDLQRKVQTYTVSIRRKAALPVSPLAMPRSESDEGDPLLQVRLGRCASGTGRRRARRWRQRSAHTGACGITERAGPTPPVWPALHRPDPDWADAAEGSRARP